MKLYPLLIMANLALGVTGAAGVEIVAHRGASHEAPENTLASISLAWEENADAAEVDVFVTSDGRIIAIHDPTTGRTAGADLAVAESSFEDLRKLDVGAWKGPQWKDERIPSLEDVLEILPPAKRLYIEIKCGEEILDPLTRVLAPWEKRAGQIVLIGFSYELMSAAKRRFPHFLCHWLVSVEQIEGTNEWEPPIPEVAARAQAAGFDGISLGNAPALDAEAARIVRAHELLLLVWTVNNAGRARALSALGVHSITTDRPGWLRKQLREALSDPKR
ncbi:MAG TPA: glycerophosphodiester phosphodiesterase family protein [Verrucomicrobiales bacterium]|nr:glycerophosphodiester phosphodiesterase family protein [Verrucomicrobiales bacterium]